MDKKEILRLQILAEECRLNVVRMLRASGHGHVGGALSCIDIVTALYYYKMRVNPQDPAWPERDRFVLSAGHKCMAQYAVLANKGYFPMDILDTYGALGTKIPGHPDMKKLPGIEANTGALGHGLAISAGMALGLRIGGSDSRVYTVMGDGELAEGSNWEAAAAAAHHHLDHLTAFVDFNGLQISGRVTDVMNFTPINEHFRAFGWAVTDIDGNDMSQVVDVLDRLPLEEGRPSLVVAHTIKCKGISSGEDQVSYHYWSPTSEELDAAEAEIEERIEALKAMEEVAR